MDLTPVHTLNLTGVLSESKRLILSNYTHFLTLSLFFLPLSYSLINQPFSFSNHHPNPITTSYIIFTLTTHLLSLCAIATITHTTHHAFFTQPINFSHTLNSLIFSIFPLAFTAIIEYALLTFISITFVFIVGTLVMLVNSLGFVVDYNSLYFMWFSAFMGVILIVIVVYFHVEWSLASVVVVVESKWGFSALVRSSYLVEGMRSVSLLVRLYFWVFGGLIVWMCSVNTRFIVVMMLGLFFVLMFLLRVVAANTVLYNYCKALHGELAIEVDDGFGCEYMSLPLDDEKVPHVVTVVSV